MTGPDSWDFAGLSVAQRRRFQQIMKLLYVNGFATVEELVETLKVSRMTVHRDLDELHNRGSLMKVRGGATVARTENFESSWRYRRNQHQDWKLAIAQRAAELVEPGDSIIIDPSTTGHIFCQLLRDKTPLKVVTPSLAIIADLAMVSGIELHVIGGVYDPHFNAFMGANAEEEAAKFRVDKAFMSTAAVSGHTICHSQARAIALDRQLFNAAREHILMVDSSKLGHTALHVFGDASEWQWAITDSNADPAHLEELRGVGVEVAVAQP
ncbi:MAG: DeoR/GlpR family DNA-binding transcription regulator [Propionibacteriaceae bacterium]|nr:DeoR/GlpR family DNA-binding transcription regulator [Propionibacteriaceae bacterium]